MKQIQPEITAWRKKAQHLPMFMRDFHDQKDLFKMIHELTTIEPDRAGKEISWVDGYIYAIDTFLWAMARFGYTLQKTSKKLDFEDIKEVIEFQREERGRAFESLLTSIKDKETNEQDNM